MICRTFLITSSVVMLGKANTCWVKPMRTWCTLCYRRVAPRVGGCAQPRVHLVSYIASANCSAQLTVIAKKLKEDFFNTPRGFAMFDRELCRRNLIVCLVAAAAALGPTGCIPAVLVARPCADPMVAPLNTGTFASAKITNVTLPASVTAEDRATVEKYSTAFFGHPMKADEIVPTMLNQLLDSLPAFNGGPLPEVQLNVKINKGETYADGYIALDILSILYFPLGWLLGIPTGGCCFSYDVVYTATVGDFQRDYHYTTDRCAVLGLYYQCVSPGSIMGHTVLALARDLTHDYEAHRQGSLSAHPEALARDVGNEDAWSVRKTCTAQPASIVKSGAVAK